MLGNLAMTTLGSIANGTGIGDILNNATGVGESGFDVSQIIANGNQASADRIAMMQANHQNDMAAMTVATQNSLEASAMKEGFKQLTDAMEFGTQASQQSRDGALDFLGDLA
jgi:hypothetical protein